MKNVIILGSGRSGTSMVAGCFSKTCSFMGHSLLPANSANPKGYFEDKEVNSINEDLLESVAPNRFRFIGNYFQRTVPLRNQRWLLLLKGHKEFTVSDDLGNRINSVVKREPYCLKDPRFSYTLPAWSPYLLNVNFVVVFRHPFATIESIMRLHRSDPALRSLSLSFDRALEVWCEMYSRILSYSRTGNWLFIHFDQLFSDQGLDRLASFSGAQMDVSFPDKTLRSTLSNNRKMSGRSATIYNKLCLKSGD